MAEPKEKTSLVERIKLTLTIIGVVSPVLAFLTFVGIKPEKRKQLDWEYVSKGSVVNTSPAATTNVTIFYSGREMKQLTVVSAQLVNTGGVPIEGDDIEDGEFPSVYFGSNLVVGAEINSRRPENLKAKLIVGTNSLKVEHGLMNPTDLIGVQILLEGDPGNVSSLPGVSYRIAGITTPTTRYPDSASSKDTITFFPLPPVAEYICLFLTTILLVLPIGLTVLLVLEIQRSFRAPDDLIRAFPLVASKFASNIGQADSKFQEQLANEFYFVIKHAGFSKKVRDEIRKFKIGRDEKSPELLARIETELRNRFLPKTRFGRFRIADKSDYFGLCFFAVMSVCSSLVILGCWHRMLDH